MTTTTTMASRIEAACVRTTGSATIWRHLSNVHTGFHHHRCDDREACTASTHRRAKSETTKQLSISKTSRTTDRTDSANSTANFAAIRSASLVPRTGFVELVQLCSQLRESLGCSGSLVPAADPFGLLSWTEPAILVLIVLQVVVQTIRSSYDVYTHPRPTLGYFHTWEDVVLFVIFCAFTVEIVARIVVTGLVINPPRPELPADAKIDAYSTPSRTPSIVTRIQSRLSPLRSPASARRSPFSDRPATPSSRPRYSADSLDPSAALNHLDPSSAFGPQGPRSATYPPQAGTVGADDIIAHDYGNETGGDVSRGTAQAALVHEGTVAAEAPVTTIRDVHDYSLKAGLASTGSVAMGVAEGNYAASSTHGSTGTGPGPFAYRFAPYALSIKRQRQTYQHAFLRHSFNRIDLVAVVAFWISFVLAMTGAEAAHNLWFFRALSVLRATRLLAITRGTQTILQSLKKASPLLVNVGFFTAFAMILFS